MSAAALQHLHLSALQGSYRVTGTKDQAVGLAVRFSDGQGKRTHYYGATGTCGLANRYAPLYKLRETHGGK